MQIVNRWPFEELLMFGNEMSVRCEKEMGIQRRGRNMEH